MFIFPIIFVGMFACFIFDIWQDLLRRISGIPTSNWALVGRWFWGVVSDRCLVAKGLSSQDPRPYELQLGWAIHYLVAIGYAFTFWILMEGNIVEPSILDGLIFGVVSVVIPWFFFMPALGNGIMARHTPNPPLACSLAFMMHSVFGIAIGTGFSVIS